LIKFLKTKTKKHFSNKNKNVMGKGKRGGGKRKITEVAEGSGEEEGPKTPPQPQQTVKFSSSKTILVYFN